MSKINNLLAQLTSAADELRAGIYDLDDRIAALAQERDMLNDSPLSKCDYLEFIRHDIARKSELFANELRGSLKLAGFEFGTLDRKAKTQEGFFIPYLTGGFGFPGPITQSGIYFYFGDALVERIGALLDTQEWPETAIPAAERPRLIGELDAEIQGLRDERALLVAQLQEAGLER